LAEKWKSQILQQSTQIIWRLQTAKEVRQYIPGKFKEIVPDYEVPTFH
jgi:hypothetical protein